MSRSFPVIILVGLLAVGALGLSQRSSFVADVHKETKEQTHSNDAVAPKDFHMPRLSQPRFLSTSIRSKAAQWQRLQELKGVAWVHIPRCGSSFVNVLLHHPGVCPKIPADAWVEEDEDGFPLQGFFAKYPKKEYCAGGFMDPQYFHDPPGHGSVGQYWENIAGHGFILFRQPEQRVLSAYHNFHMGVFVDHHLTAKEYGQIEEGCMVKMLTRWNHPNDYRDPHSWGWQGPCVDIHEASPPSHDEVEEAKLRLRTGFPFIGITDKWDLSVCLFHVMFGGHCQDKMFKSVRPYSVGHVNKQNGGYDPRELEGWVDEADNALYNEAMQLFESNLDKFGVTESNCPQICKEEPPY